MRLLLLLLTSVLSAYGQTGPGTRSTPAPPFSVTAPYAVQPVNIDQSATLVYELHITNESTIALTIKGLYLLQIDKRKSDTVFHYDEAVLGNRMAPLNGNHQQQGTMIPPGETYILYIEAGTAQLRPIDMRHLIHYQFAGSDSIGQLIYFNLLQVHTTEPVLLSPPLRGGNWTAIYDPSWQRGHRRVVYTTAGKQHIPGRFAIDFMQVDSVKYARDENSTRTYYGYGAEVLAVADGEVAAVCDSFPESRTLAAHPKYTAAQATGNYVALQIAPDRYAFYEHLQPGSITVKPGQRIKRGQVIARLGFTGQTTGPHLHFHVADRNSPLDAEGVPFVFDRFKLIGRYPDFSQFGKMPFIRIAPEPVTREMPASNTVVVFD